ncbi:Nif3-like dinuclear metal center hexameric protein [Synechococcales cyanobacterium C]|uniref:GTP cyclohydrolase 1 type 2 homolog n=1 Tax=Petrachloros mirabilis ULC683 TaxID=2781853 RepID=A0A8K2A2Z2_9CYAN|nr:Nif3-like dinuclear metal center hexameric protein [Petrachloros mirabilis]NCJ08752.1 Nif3-like dinuclear metal center hexameric protein [Petrachloros mirabilis ULC683]
MKIVDLIQWFESWNNPDWQESWDNCGWQIQPGVLDQSARVLVCLTPTLAVMEEALSLQAQGIPVNLIFAHHPLIFSPLKSVCQGTPIGEMIHLAITHQIGVYTAHTNFDQVADGTADVLAQLLNLENVEPVVPTQLGLGYGRVGNLAEPLPLAALLPQIQATLNPATLISSPTTDPQMQIKRLAVLGGSGASFIPAVVKSGAQAYLTSDCKFHQFQESRDRNLILIDAGHYATERPACGRLVEKFQTLGLAWAQLSKSDEDFRQVAESGIGKLSVSMPELT